MPDDNSKTVTTTTDTKTLIVAQFGRAGPWALLAVLVLGGVGYEMDYLLKRYVQQSEETMNSLRTNTHQLSEAVNANLTSTTQLQSAVSAAHELIESNTKLLAEGNSQHIILVELMEAAGADMKHHRRRRFAGRRHPDGADPGSGSRTGYAGVGTERPHHHRHAGTPIPSDRGNCTSHQCSHP